MMRSAYNNHTSNGRTITETAHPAGSKLYTSLARNVLLVFFPLLSLALIAFIETSVQNNAYATAEITDVVDDVSISVPTSCTITAVLENREYSVSINPGSTGEVEANIITTSCNDPGGYSLYAIGFTGDTETGNNHTKLVGSNTGGTISTGTNTGSGSSSWAMKLTFIANAEIMNSYGSYQVVPNTWTQVARYTSSTSTSTVKPWYRIFVDSSQPADAYTGQVKYAIVHPNTYVAGTYTIAYNANGGTGTMTSSTNLYNFEPFTLPASTLTAPTGYAFAGWCTTNTSQYSCDDGTLYQPGDEVTSLATAGGTANLYAVWGPLKAMQSATSADCGQEMVDTRDGNTYTTATIGSLCWMTKNLDLPGGTTLSSADTNVPDNYSTTTTGFTDGNTLPTSSTTGFNNDTTAFVYNSNSTECSYINPCYSYYSWRAATAGYNVTSDGASTNYDICPKNWRLPTSVELNSLVSVYSTGSVLTQSPFYGVYAGDYFMSSFENGGSAGEYWSSTSNASNRSYALEFYSTTGDVNYFLKKDGLSIRCVAKS